MVTTSYGITSYGIKNNRNLLFILVVSMFIYIISLENNKYYIMGSDDANFNIKSLITFNTLDWLLVNKPLLIEEKIVCDECFTVNDYVFEYMRRYGKNYVRGGDYISLVLPKHQCCELNTIIEETTTYSEHDSYNSMEWIKPKALSCCERFILFFRFFKKQDTCTEPLISDFYNQESS